MGWFRVDGANRGAEHAHTPFKVPPFPALRVKYCGIVKLNCFKIELKNEYASFSFYDQLNRDKVQINKAFGCLLNLNLKTFGS
jgi:hypothetical protein